MRGFVAQFEIDPVWVPSLDRFASFTRMFLSSNQLTWFEQRGIYAARVLNTSSVGRHFSPLAAALRQNPPPHLLWDCARLDPIASAMIAVTKLLILTPSRSACFVSLVYSVRGRRCRH